MGLEQIVRGGRAADAAISAALALFVLLPEACGLGGDGFALVADDGQVRAYNGSGRTPRDWTPTGARSGGATVAVPGAVAALADIHARHGRLAWSDVVAPAVGLAEAGVSFDPIWVAMLAKHRGRLEASAGGWDVLRRTAAGETFIQQPHLARSLQRLAQSGPEAFYAGPIADAIVRAARADGSVLNAADLGDHETVMSDPAVISMGDIDLLVAPPVSQAVLAGFALASLDSRDLRSDVPRSHLVMEAIEEAFQQRSALCRPGGIDALPWGWRPTGGAARRRGGATGTSHTTSVAAADAGGQVVTLLVSIFHEFGSGCIVPEWGFFLNNRLLGMDHVPQASGARPLHTLSPAMLRTPDTLVGLATPGADAQVQVLAQVLDPVIRDSVTWEHALARPRWRMVDQTVLVEATMDPAVIAELARLGHDIRLCDPGDPAFGAVTAAGMRDHACWAAADGRRFTSARAAMTIG